MKLQRFDTFSINEAEDKYKVKVLAFIDHPWQEDKEIEFVELMDQNRANIEKASPSVIKGYVKSLYDLNIKDNGAAMQLVGDKFMSDLQALTEAVKPKDDTYGDQEEFLTVVSDKTGGEYYEDPSGSEIHYRAKKDDEVVGVWDVEDGIGWLNEKEKEPEDIQTAKYELLWGSGPGRGTFIIINRHNDRNTMRETGSDAMAMYNKMSKELSRGTEYFYRFIEKNYPELESSGSLGSTVADAHRKKIERQNKNMPKAMRDVMNNESDMSEKEWKLTLDIHKEWRDLTSVDVKDEEEFARAKSNVVKALRAKADDVREKIGKETASLFREIVGKLRDAETAEKFHKMMEHLYDLADENGIYISAIKESEEVFEKLSRKAQDFISKKIAYLKDKEGKDDEQAQAIAYSFARRAGFRIPKSNKE